MEILALCPLRPAAFTWRSARGGHVLTVVCKATFSLTIGEAQLAARQDAPTEQDRHHDDNPAASLYLPSDLVPFKPRADVLLVGSAYAPRGQPARSLAVQLSVGGVDKSLVVVGPRAAEGGRFGEPAPFESMPLRWELAAAGPANPVGVRPGTAPNIVPLGDPAAPAEPIGFGPIAPSWPGRVEKLGGVPPAWMQGAWAEQPLPASVEPFFFNVAPPDQQCNPIRPGETLVLKGLRPDLPHLVTRLPGLTPRCFLQRAGAAPQDVHLKCDTLIVDTDRGVCTLTFRGQAPLDSPVFAGRVVVAMERPGQQLSWADLERMSPELRTPPGAAPEPVISHRAPAVEQTLQQKDFQPSVALPFAGGAPPAQAPVPPPAFAPLPAATPFSSPPSTPVPFSAASPMPPPASAPVPPEPLPVAPPSSSPWASSAPPPASSLEAVSNAAAAPWTAPRDEPPPAPVARPASTPKATPDILHLVWVDKAVAPSLRKNPAWKKLLDDLEYEPADGDLDDPPDGGPGPAARSDEADDQRDVFNVCARGEAIDGPGLVESLMGAVRADGKFVPPLTLAAGEIAFSFDELETLKATVAAVTPFAGADKPLKDTVDAVREILAAPDLRSSSGVEGVTQRVREAFAQGKRPLPQGYLDGVVSRVLLEQRAYQQRVVLGAPHLRALFHLNGDVVPAYLPEGIAPRLPLFKRFKARLLAFVHPQEDEAESHPCALRVAALARVIPAPWRR